MSAALHSTPPVVVIGSGIAGLTTALSLAPHPVLLITRAALGGETSSAWAQGGIAAAMGADDSVELHLADTIAAGDGLVDESAARAILAEGPQAIHWLERQGVTFDRHADGSFALGLEAAHGRRRIVHGRGDASGATVVAALVNKMLATPSITVLAQSAVRRLAVQDGRVTGVEIEREGGLISMAASAVVLATGGLGGLYDATTNPQGNFGQGIALAARAGAALADMEFVQFHPTALASARTPLALVSEAVRGEGAHLINERGERFMSGTAGAELAPRDVVARAISAELARGGQVFLDARPVLGNRFGQRFPTIAALCREAHIDPAGEAIPVRPAVHYHMGGVATDLDGRTSVEGLWAVGEVACTGLHGANRLASNSLLEATVTGLRAARDIETCLAKPAAIPAQMPKAEIPLPCPNAQSIRTLVSHNLGVLRHEAGMKQAIATLYPLAVGKGEAADPALVALAIATFGLLRRESRGAHARTDFPAPAEQIIRRRMVLADIFRLAEQLDPTALAKSA